MPSGNHYECLRRVIGICGSGCEVDDKNLNCPNYYPCHRMQLGSEIITYHPADARAIQSELLRKVEEARISAKKSSPIESVSD